MLRKPGHGRYAHVEREQRWLATELPKDAEYQSEIVDRYIIGTRMRLRRVTSPEGETLKFGQKVRDVIDDPETVRLTNMYLSPEEYATLSLLPFAELHKTRYQLTIGAHTFAVDMFHGRHDGLVLAETEILEGERRLDPPQFARAEVTNDDRYSGGALAFATDRFLRENLPFM